MKVSAAIGSVSKHEKILSVVKWNQQAFLPFIGQQKKLYEKVNNFVRTVVFDGCCFDDTGMNLETHHEETGRDCETLIRSKNAISETWRRMDLVRAEVSEECVASTFKPHPRREEKRREK
jgi:hypothetical protein